MSTISEARLAENLQTTPLVFLDLETTGLDLGAGHRVCEIALVRMQAGQVTGTLDMLVNPARPLDAGAAAVNGLRDEELLAAPPFAAVAQTIVDLLQDATPVAHNLYFDLAFLDAELRGAGLSLAAEPALDTLQLARRLLKGTSYSLAALAGLFDLSPPTHRAMGDVRSLIGLFEQLRQLMAAQGITTLGDALRLQRGLAPGEAEPEAPEPIMHAIRNRRPLRIVYQSRSSGEPIARTIVPHYLTRERNGVFVRAFCRLRNDMRTFAVRKIITIEEECEPSSTQP
jgi:DNA polymerase-3 subunit epsilon